MDVIRANANPRIKAINKLNKDASERKKQGVFIVEGIRMFQELPVQLVQSVYISEGFYNKNKTKLEHYHEHNQGIEMILVSDSVFCAISQTKSPQGIMAVAKTLTYTMEDIVKTACGREAKKQPDATYLILESIQDPGNLGTIMRSAEASDVTGIIIGGSSCDMYNPKVVRSTMGAIFRVPFVYVENLKTTICAMKEAGITIYGAHLSGENLYRESFQGAVAFLIGNEGNGLSKDIADTADRLIKIPMAGKVESLNAATSAALLTYEVFRRRQ